MTAARLLQTLLRSSRSTFINSLSSILMALHLLNVPKQFSLTHDHPGLPLTRTSIKPRIQCSAGKQTLSQSAERRSANYQPAVWSSDLLESLKRDDKEEIFGGRVKKLEEMYEERAKKLEERVKSRMYDDKIEPLALLELIDDVQWLGLEYRLEKDIKKALERRILEGSNVESRESSLHHTALTFRILRQHGYEVSQDVFKSFLDHNGGFKESLRENVRGMLSLYEASHLAFEEENHLHEAMAFTEKHLKELEEDVDKSLKELVSHAMELPLHHRMRRLEARWSIEAYKRKEDGDDVLLELAILDFNMVQSAHRKELQEVSSWWRRMGLANKLQFARDRLMESFFWSLGMVFEPEFSNCRIGLTKVVTLITIFDDVYDIYGSLDELEQLTVAVSRWDISMVNDLPDYMKLCFLALYNTVNEMAYDILKEQGENILPDVVNAWADLCKVFLQEAKWFYNKSIPSFDENLENGWRSSSGAVLLTHSYFLMSKNITKEAVEYLEKDDDLLRWPSTIFRLCNDLASYKAELERGESANSISCYMQKTGVSEEVAYNHMSKLIDETWKKMNKVRAVESSSPFEKSFVETAINLARIAQCTYQHGDSHSAPDYRSKKRV